MKRILRKPFLVFLILMLSFALPLFLFPISIFPGEIVHIVGAKEIVAPADLSLSYFIGIGINKEDLEGVKEFYLTAQGKILALIFIIGLPAILAYRVKLRKPQEEK